MTDITIQWIFAANSARALWVNDQYKGMLTWKDPLYVDRFEFYPANLRTTEVFYDLPLADVQAAVEMLVLFGDRE